VYRAGNALPEVISKILVESNIANCTDMDSIFLRDLYTKNWWQVSDDKLRDRVFVGNVCV
jgi:hypothetical protein